MTASPATSDLAIVKPAATRSPRTAALAYEVEILGDLDAMFALLDREAPGATATPFQDRAWLTAWRDAMAGATNGVEVFAAVVRRSGDGVLALALPLVRRRRDGLVTIEPPDDGVTDYNAPVLGPAAPTDEGGARALWRALRRALPKADLFACEKSPRDLMGRANPLALIAAAQPSRIIGNIIDIDEPFETFVRGFERKFRKELGREKRVFEAIPGARFEILTEPASALAALDKLADMQAARIHALGRDYALDESGKAELYRALLRDGCVDGRAVISVLRVGDEIVAALLGLVTRDHYAMVRLGQAGAPWSHFSPGRLVIMETMRALRERGLRRFDFTIGEYDYKRRLGVVPVPLVDVSAALSWRGLPRILARRARATARRSPLLQKIAGRLRRRAS